MFKLRNSFGYKMEVDAETFNRVMKNNKLRVGWDICFVSEAFAIVLFYQTLLWVDEIPSVRQYPRKGSC